MKRAVTLLFLTLSLLLFIFILVIFPTRAATALQTTPAPTPTIKACHICDEGLPQPIVHAILFWMNGCPHCHEVLDNVLPPLKEKYGAQLEILLVEVVDVEDVNHLYAVAATYDIPRDRVGVPFLILGDQVLIGSQQIPEELPGLIEHYLAQGGIDRPSIPNLNEFLIQTTPTPVSISTLTEANVRAILFTTLDCRSCQLELDAALGPVREKYGEQFEIRTVDILTSEDVEYLYQIAESYGIPHEEVDLPLVILGEHVLIGEQLAQELPDLVASYQSAGGVDWPSIPARSKPVLPEAETAPQPEAARSSGFTLAILVMVGMVAVLSYSLLAFWRGNAFSLPVWADWFIPALIVIGIGVAGYLSYVEAQSVPAVCGPVGDCNAVQSSRYAKLFDFLPIGVLGLFGYLALLAVWLARKFLPSLEKISAIGFWSLAFFGVIFSLYLTYLEPFVIRAVCIWCLASAVIVTLLLLLGTPPAVLRFAIPDDNK